MIPIVIHPSLTMILCHITIPQSNKSNLFPTSVGFTSGALLPGHSEQENQTHTPNMINPGQAEPWPVLSRMERVQCNQFATKCQVSPFLKLIVYCRYSIHLFCRWVTHSTVEVARPTSIRGCHVSVLKCSPVSAVMCTLFMTPLSKDFDAQEQKLA